MKQIQICGTQNKLPPLDVPQLTLAFSVVLKGLRAKRPYFGTATTTLTLNGN